MKIFAVFDRQAEFYATPMFMLQPGQASRAFADEVNRSATDNPLYHHPDDFDLYFLGEYDPVKGVITPLSSPELVALGKNLKITNGSGS